MAAIKYKVKLAESERSRLNEVSHRGKPSVRTVKRALALLKADEGLRDGEIAGVLLINAATVARVRKRFVEEGLEAAINDKPRPGRERTPYPVRGRLWLPSRAAVHPKDM